jgi:hypothetical protein
MIVDRLLHTVARIAVRARPPLEAKRIVDAVGRLLPPLSLGTSMRVAQELGGRGSCLTRALAVSSRLPGSEVVLGTDGVRDRDFSAHAWVEHDGTLVSGAPAARHEMVRLRTGDEARDA